MAPPRPLTKDELIDVLTEGLGAFASEVRGHLDDLRSRIEALESSAGEEPEEDDAAKELRKAYEADREAERAVLASALDRIENLEKAATRRTSFDGEEREARGTPRNAIAMALSNPNHRYSVG